MDAGENLYQGGFAKLLNRQEKRQRPFDGAAAVLPAPDVDFAPYFTTFVPPPTQHSEEVPRFSAQRKWLQLQLEFEGQPQILHLHAMLIAISRRDDPPDVAISLFHRLWSEQGAKLANMLTTRWKVSAAASFGDIGVTGDQRACGTALHVMFDMMKLHDSERRNSGQPGRRPFRSLRESKRFPLAFGLDAYSFKGGDLDMILLARIWQLCERDATIRPLGFALLRMVMSDPRSIFGRVQQIKKATRDDD
ncbi:MULTISPECIES: hypothetical protein [Roseobacteraceae]|jgi:hypothetical protein|uniref:Uncharacterized protein n=1 Tax=Pseudosulfitobacter pseudonitzschiae TaxID=1402135 RepID=A0A221K183_9RHOB|nr:MULTISPECIES: hypothetical protein [Roseobacteraceae]ASM72650.1 hypothetical protein SULPSESMR1_01842 [Pseudosulfitobacter pseudonitzschiae]